MNELDPTNFLIAIISGSFGGAVGGIVGLATNNQLSGIIMAIVLGLVCLAIKPKNG